MEIKPINIAEQAERVRVPRLQTLVWLMLASILLTGLGLWAYENVKLEPLLSRLTFLQVEEVKITSEWPLTQSTIRSWLPKLEGRNILFVQPTRLIEALKARPWTG